jgi:aspartyl-tRNA(Asn)/glutamyl-tRNA(Gln) amidotransferase subunit A
LAYLALGTDIAGSIRIPASFCGLVGHKPSLGRVPRIEPGVNLNVLDTNWVIGPMARTVADAALALRIIAGPDERDPFALLPLQEKECDPAGELRGLRIAWCLSPTGTPVDPGVARATEAAVRLLAGHGVQVQTLDTPLDPPQETLVSIFAAKLASAFRERLPTVREQLSSTLVEFVTEGLGVTLDQYFAGQLAISAFIERMASVFERYDLLATPTTAIPAFSTEHVWGPPQVDQQAIDHRAGWLFTWPFNLTGHPALSLPCGWSPEGLPYGLQLVGRRRADGLVLRVAAAIERAGPWPRKRPALEAVS